MSPPREVTLTWPEDVLFPAAQRWAGLICVSPPMLAEHPPALSILSTALLYFHGPARLVYPSGYRWGHERLCYPLPRSGNQEVAKRDSSLGPSGVAENRNTLALVWHWTYLPLSYLPYPRNGLTHAHPIPAHRTEWLFLSQHVIP